MTAAKQALLPQYIAPAIDPKLLRSHAPIIRTQGMPGRRPTSGNSSPRLTITTTAHGRLIMCYGGCPRDREAMNRRVPRHYRAPTIRELVARHGIDEESVTGLADMAMDDLSGKLPMVQ
jgi:hypothetical protein